MPSARKYRLAATRAGLLSTPQIATSQDKIDSARNGLLKPERKSADLGCGDALRLKIFGQRHRLVLADVLWIEALAVEVAGLDQDRRPAE